MPEEKELHFFDQRFGRGIDWYAAQFAGAHHEQQAGEATPLYMSRTEAVDRMSSVIPDARLVAILRDPVERAYSHYWRHKVRGRADGSFASYIESDPSRFEAGRYVDQLRYVCERFPRGQLLVLFYEDLRDQPRDVYAEACRFIGVDDEYLPTSLGRTFNQYAEYRSLRVKRWSKKLPLPRSTKRVIARFNTRAKTSYPPMDQTARTWLAGLYSESNAELAQWLDRDLPDWSVPPIGDQQSAKTTEPSKDR
jgi:Sulfotransferase domain